MQLINMIMMYYWDKKQKQKQKKKRVYVLEGDIIKI